MKTLNNVQVIIINGKINYNYKGVLYTDEQFQELLRKINS